MHAKVFKTVKNKIASANPILNFFAGSCKLSDHMIYKFDDCEQIYPLLIYNLILETLVYY